MAVQNYKELPVAPFVEVQASLEDITKILFGTESLQSRGVYLDFKIGESLPTITEAVCTRTGEDTYRLYGYAEEFDNSNQMPVDLSQTLSFAVDNGLFHSWKINNGKQKDSQQPLPGR